MTVFRRFYALPLVAAGLSLGTLAADPARAADTTAQQGATSAAQIPGTVELNPKATAPYDPLNAAEAARAEAWTATARIGDFVQMARTGQVAEAKEMAEPALLNVVAAVERAEQAASRSDSPRVREDLLAARAALDRAQGYVETLRQM